MSFGRAPCAKGGRAIKLCKCLAVPVSDTNNPRIHAVFRFKGARTAVPERPGAARDGECDSRPSHRSRQNPRGG